MCLAFATTLGDGLLFMATFGFATFGRFLAASGELVGVGVGVACCSSAASASALAATSCFTTESHPSRSTFAAAKRHAISGIWVWVWVVLPLAALAMGSCVVTTSVVWEVTVSVSVFSSVFNVRGTFRGIISCGACPRKARGGRVVGILIVPPRMGVLWVSCCVQMVAPSGTNTQFPCATVASASVLSVMARNWWLLHRSETRMTLAKTLDYDYDSDSDVLHVMSSVTCYILVM